MPATLLQLVGLLVAVVVPLASFVAGLRSTEPLWLWRRPRLLGRSLLAILLLVPLAEMLLVEVLSPANVLVRAGIAVSVLSIGLGPPVLLKRTQAPNEAACYELGLNLTLMLAAVVFMPIAVAVHGAVFHHTVRLPWEQVARVVLVKALVPFLAGVALARGWPRLAVPVERHAPGIIGAAMVLVAAVAVPATWRYLLALGAGAWLTCAAVALAAVAIGHALGGPDRETRGVLASFSALRFPALALLLASNVPRGQVLVPVVLAYVVCGSVVVGAYHAAMRASHRRPDVRVPGRKGLARRPGRASVT